MFRRSEEIVPVVVVLICDAQSLWNKENRFSSWADPELSREI